jgi:SAM-dependent methyltransferase
MMTKNPWDDRYNRDDFYYGKEPNEFLRANAGMIPSKGKVLCLAEGEGRNAVFLAGLGFEVLAVDGSSVGLSKLERLAAERGVKVRTLVSDLADFPIEAGYWDGIVSIWCHVPPELRMNLHRKVVTGLAVGGVLILESYRPKQLDYKTGGPPSADLMMTAESLSRELEGLDLIVLKEVDRMVHEGKGHDGMSAVVQVLGRKGN